MSDEEVKKPIIFYIDDEPRSLSLFELAVPEDWEVHCFESAVEALKCIKEMKPDVVLSDQRMPHMTGLELLELTAQLLPDTVRIIATGFTDEEIIIELVRRAQIFDYVIKPWNTDDLISRLKKGFIYNQAVRERKQIVEALKQNNAELEKANLELQKSFQQLQESIEREKKLFDLVDGWAPWPIINALKEHKGEIPFPFRSDIVCLVFDIVDSFRYADTMIEERSLRSCVINMFMEHVIRNGGLIEHQAGDACYAHFGAFNQDFDPCKAAWATAREFRVMLRTFSDECNIVVECGIAMHYARNTLINQDIIKAPLRDGTWRTSKSVHTQSNQVDLVHRLEKLCHKLPGSNIIITGEFLKHLPLSNDKILLMGKTLVKGQHEPFDVHLYPSDLITEKDLEDFKIVLKEEQNTWAKEPKIKIKRTA